MSTKRALLVGLSFVLCAGMLSVPAVAAGAATQTAPAEPGAGAHPAGAGGTGRSTVDPAARDKVLPSGWRSSTDMAWTTDGDPTGFHVLVAEARTGYTWRTAATLAEPGIETDRWVGNACVTGSGRRAVVVYAPRTFTNKAELFDRGAFTAVIALDTGVVRKLALRTSLAYFNPACGAGDEAVLTQAGDLDLGRTRLLELDTATGRIGAPIEVPGQLTSAVPTAGGIVAADAGAVVRVAKDGTRRRLAQANSVPFKLAADADGGVVYLERTGAGEQAVARRLDAPTVRAGRGAPATLTTGPLGTLDVTSGRGGQVYVTGAGRTGPSVQASSVALLDVPAGSRVSTHGGLAVTAVTPARPADPRGTAAPRHVTIEATALTTGRSVSFADVPTGTSAAAGRTLTPALGQAGNAPEALAAGDPDDPADFAERYCSVPRNDPANQAMQPKPRQVEWAVDQAVRNSLYVQRPASWKNLGMPAYRPQDLFPPIPLLGGGHVPAQVMLGIAAQESNLWQAARYAVPGVTANPLIGNYYGLDIYNATEADDWTIRWDHADCGYGVTQVTDGMRRAGREKPGETALPYDQQRAVALDFAANVAAGLRILQSKWNETRAAGLVVNNGNPSKIENWFFAVWAYNSGFHPLSEAAANDGAWGVGWANNPANPRYPANRGAFLEDDLYRDDYADAAHPQDWPYPEKVMGWAGHPVEVLEAPDTLVSGYRAAWWCCAVDGPENRHNVSPPHRQFCDASNNCEWGAQHLPNDPEVIGEPAGPCAHRNAAGRYDLKCWYHEPTTWKPQCDSTCGNELLRFDPGYPYQEDGTAYPPACDLSGLPAGARVIDNLPDGTPSIRPGCGRPWTNAGTFNLSYGEFSGEYPGKIDTHQLGMGLGGHFWMVNARTATTGEGVQLKVTGRWRFAQPYTGVANVWVHLPPLVNGTAQARYTIKTKYGERVSVVNLRGNTNRWVRLGVFLFDGPPEVTLTTITPDGDGTQRIAFDAVAYAPVTSSRALKVLHWNVAGAALNDGNYYVVDRLIQEILARQADIVSVNEICANQFDILRGRLIVAGYRMEGEFHLATEVNLTCWNSGDLRFGEGNAVLVKADVVDSQDYGFDEDEGLVEGRSGTGRGVACVTARFSGTDRDVKACSTHLETGYPDDPTSTEQVRQLADEFGREARQMPLILAGDTNIPAPPENPAMGALYGAPIGTGDFGEIEQERACVTSPTCELAQGGPATYKDRKIDYIFADRWHFRIPPGRAVVNQDVGMCGEDPHPCSDHSIVYGEAVLPAG